MSISQLTPTELEANNEALRRAALEGTLDELQRLLPLSDPKAANKEGWTALHRAAFWGRMDCIRALLHVSDAKAVDEDGMTAAAVAKKFNNEDCARLIEAFELARAEREALASIAPATEKAKRTARSL